MEKLYLENIIDHFKHPRNYGVVENADIQHHDHNPLCGDDISITIKIDRGKISDVKFQGHGCAISQASASMLTEKIKGKNIGDVKGIKSDDVIKLLGIPLSPLRMKCALLGFQVMTAGISKHKYGLREHGI
ncbi:SUF system NifU family Fe-S cluster assembly protein [Candidatus Woesearchaeota archaeon]|nr:SUF system NifU family Fe-S cluster assembly protein [Candidatus Woesearchaeota archaeon]